MPPPQRAQDDDGATAIASPSFDAMLEAREAQARPEEAMTAIDARSFDELLAEREKKEAEEHIGYAQTASGLAYEARVSSAAGASAAPKPPEPAGQIGAIVQTMVLAEPPPIVPAREAPRAANIASPLTPTPFVSHAPAYDAPRAASPRASSSAQPASAVPHALPAKPRMGGFAMFVLSALVTFVVLGALAGGVIAFLLLRGG